MLSLRPLLDTAFRSARLIVADATRLDQRPIRKRLYIAIPLFALSALLLWYNIADSNGFNTVWRYFGWANQTLASFMLWTATVYLVRKKGGLKYLVTFIPALVMTAVCVSFICVDKTGFRVPQTWNYPIGLITFAISLILSIFGNTEI